MVFVLEFESPEELAVASAFRRRGYKNRNSRKPINH